MLNDKPIPCFVAYKVDSTIFQVGFYYTFSWWIWNCVEMEHSPHSKCRHCHLFILNDVLVSDIITFMYLTIFQLCISATNVN